LLATMAQTLKFQQTCNVLLGEFRHLEGSLLAHCQRSTAAKTVSALTGVAAVPALFLAPPVGVGLGMASAASGGGAAMGDMVMDRAKSPKWVATAGRFDRAISDYVELQQGLVEEAEGIAQEMVEFSNAVERLQNRNDNLQSRLSLLEAQGAQRSAIRDGVAVATTANSVIGGTKTLVAFSKLPLEGATVVRVGTSANGVMTAGKALAPLGRGSSGVAKCGTMVVSRAAVGFAAFGAVVSVIDAMKSWKSNSNSSQIIGQLTEAIAQLEGIIQSLDGDIEFEKDVAAAAQELRAEKKRLREQEMIMQKAEQDMQRVLAQVERDAECQRQQAVEEVRMKKQRQQAVEEVRMKKQDDCPCCQQ